jgi:hypothetical protein
MGRFALHRPGQRSPLWTRWHAMGRRGVTLVLPHRLRLGYRPTALFLQRATDMGKGFPLAPDDRVSSLREIR